jgi:hypothetical protein
MPWPGREPDDRVVSEPAEYVVAHVVTALAEDARTHQMGLELVAGEHQLRVCGSVDSAHQRENVMEVVRAVAPGWHVVDDLVVTHPAERGVGEEEVDLDVRLEVSDPSGPRGHAGSGC